MEIKRNIIVQYSPGWNRQGCISPVGDKSFVTNIDVVGILASPAAWFTVIEKFVGRDVAYEGKGNTRQGRRKTMPLDSHSFTDTNLAQELKIRLQLMSQFF